MIKYFLTGLMVLSLVACGQNTGGNTGADGYSFGEKQFEKKTVTVEIVVHGSLEDLQKEAQRIGVVRSFNGEGTSVRAFTHLYPPNFDTCTMHIVDPAVFYTPEFVGHEFLHCVYGQWHTNNNLKN